MPKWVISDSDNSVLGKTSIMYLCNNLDLFLDGIYNQECEFYIGKDEVDFKRSGIETIVRKIVNKILEYDPFVGHHDDLQRVVEILNDDIQIFHSAGGKLARISTCTTDDIIKVGSFYEGTRNRFPDEFDFIFPVYCFEKTDCTSSLSANIISSILDKTYSIIYNQISEPILTLQEKDFLVYNSSAKNICYDSIVSKKGPAWKLSAFT